MTEISSAAAVQAAHSLGCLIRLRMLDPSEIPRHPILALAQTNTANPKTTTASPASTTTTTTTTTITAAINAGTESETSELSSNQIQQAFLTKFVSQILEEGSQFIDTALPQTFTPSTTKPSPPSTSPVETSKRKISAAEILNSVPKDGRGKFSFAQKWRDEYWFARRSVHENAVVEGSAGWDEFLGALVRGHSRNEGEYTPDVFDAREVCDWGAEFGKGSLEVDGWEDVGMCVYEMSHQMPFPIRNRTFSTLVVSAIDSRRTGTPSFIVVQIPVDLRNVPSALYSTGANRTQLQSKLQKKKVVMGQYVSVERCKLLKGEENGKVCWEMATASDAGGWLPMALQKLGVPGAIVKDVDFVMAWIAGRRRGN